MENQHCVIVPPKRKIDATVAIECYHMSGIGYRGDTVAWRQWIVGMKLQSCQLFADVVGSLMAFSP